MTPEYRRKLDLLCKCTFLPGSWPNRFVREIRSLPDEAMMTVKQKYLIDRLYYMYRGQISAMLGDKPEFINPTLIDKEWDKPVTLSEFVPSTIDKHRARQQLEVQEKFDRWNKKVKP